MIRMFSCSILIFIMLPLLFTCALSPRSDLMRFHTVLKGQNMTAVAKQYDVPEVVLRYVNNVPEGYQPAPGSELMIPYDYELVYVTPPAEHNQPASTRKPAKARPAQRQPLRRPPPENTAAARPAAPASAPANTVTDAMYADLRADLAWPVQGIVTKRYEGPQMNAQKGILIEVQQGAPVRAARAGTVIYSSDKIPGFGNFIILEHSGGYTTFYAHNSINLAKVGQSVNKGDKIAYAGQTGNVKTTSLYFELRKNHEAVDPLRWLPLR
ncbi:M23 family metallopeptidase [Candidatus Sumerlaeota bacterium]|nr:M23 family metallopeptidase [Candidatus Sumerlaeota bacterium]